MRTAFALCAIVALTNCSSETPEERAARNCQSELSAFSMAQAFTKRRLKSPKTADFSGWNDSVVVYQGDCIHTVQGWVDAQNSFGASVRTHYVAKLEYLKDEDKWHLHSLNM
ncbi:hypothetical protein MO867_20960 [Microbulbifer sp. OS29]|uniref:Uncharacterized protein n=1 Tax=Microbulbifer okhotskensis TaxID=2926617 RepID=A0A9X2EVQ5_9GAMM|nr:hypothetical protein [Microbulbifer okhotskensis]MCO1336801.1 hypothetical protein [Microbulbifer okhotskensis]